MNYLFKKFMKLSAKQIKAYATIFLMSSLSFQALASVEASEVNPDPYIETVFEASLDEELYIEYWMLSPFDVNMDEGSGMETIVSPAPELVFETELSFESWMAMPFEIYVNEELLIENSMCSPAP